MQGPLFCEDSPWAALLLILLIRALPASLFMR
jgi:hypothetical protein